jgi:hypothetical protein
VDEESQAILQSLEKGEISETAEKEQPLDAVHEEPEEETLLEEDEFIGEEVMPVEPVHAQTSKEKEESELVLSLADKDALEEGLEEEEEEAAGDEGEEALGSASVTVMDVIHEEPEEPTEEAAEETASVEEAEPEAETPAVPEAEPAAVVVEEAASVEEAEPEAEMPAVPEEEPAAVVTEEAAPVEEAEPEAEAGASPEEGVEGEEPFGVVEIPDEESFADVDIKGFEEADVSESAGEALPEERAAAAEMMPTGEESPAAERGVAAELHPGTGAEAVTGEETGVARADRLILEEDYAGAFAEYRKLLAGNPDDKAVIQKMEELRSLLRLLGKERDMYIARLESFIDAIKRRKDELYRNA